MYISFGVAEGSIESTKTTVFGAEVCVIDVPVDDVAYNPMRMPLTANRIGGHPNTNQVITAI
jgi:hypothetical protein